MVVAPGSWTDEVWDDINRMRTLNTTQSRRRQQMHVCPLQIDIVERIINRYSNAGDLVLDMFGGLMTVPVTALEMGRRGYGIELNPDYFRDGVGYLKEAEEKLETPTLFDFMGETEHEEKELSNQPALPRMRNNEQRKEFIDNYMSWPLWIESKETGERYYRYNFENGTSFVVRVYFHKCFDYKATERKYEDRFKDRYGSEEYYLLTEGKYFKDCLTNRSQLIEHLKNIQKGE